MKRKFLAAAVAVGPLMLASGSTMAQVTISTSTSAPVSTATVNGGNPSDLIISSSGSIGVTAAGTAVTINSNNSVSNAGQIGFTGINNAVGLLAEGGFTGVITNTAQITVTETYTATDSNNDGLLDGPFAQGTNRIGIETAGSGAFTGGILDTGLITIKGNDSEGISLQAPITGNLDMLLVTPASGSTAATLASGTIVVLGDNTVGIQVTPTGAIGGNVRIGTVSATGVGAQGVVINGNVGGSVDISQGVVVTGYRTTTRSTNPALAVLYTPDEMQQGGAAVTIGGNLGSGLIISAPPPILSTTNLDLDGNGVPDLVQGHGIVDSFGSSPAIQIGGVASGGGAAPNITLGAFSNAAVSGYGFVVQGTVAANGLFDQLTTPNLPAPVSATAIQIGGQILITPPVSVTVGTVTTVTPAVYAPSGAVNIVGGLYNSGTISAASYQGDATAIRVGAGGTAPTIHNDGSIYAISSQVNSATTVTVNGGSIPNTPAPIPVTVTAIAIDAGGSVSSIVNNSGITAEISGTGGVGGAATAIIDKSGALQNVTNTGSIVAELNQTLATTPMPGVLTAIDMRNSTLDQTISQSISSTSAQSTPYVATSSYAIGAYISYTDGNIYQAVAAAGPGYNPTSYPSYWRQVGALTPSIIGDIYFGTGNDTLSVSGGFVQSNVIAMGGGANTITVDQGAVVTGSITETTGGRFAINVINGTLSDLNPNAVNATSVDVGAKGVLLVSADPAHGVNTQFVTTGASVFSDGAQIGLTLRSLQTTPVHTYTILETTPGSGTLSVGTLGPAALGEAPFLYSATASSTQATDPATQSSTIQLTVTQKTAAELGFNAAETAAYDPVLAAIPNDANIEQAILAQTTQAGFKATYDQMLPNQGQGIFEALDAAAEKVSAMTGTTPDAGTRVAAGQSLWLQEVNERVDRSGVETLGSNSKLLGLVGGYERMGAGGGAIGMTLAYYNASEIVNNSAVGAQELASMVESSTYYRRAVGPLTISARAGGGFVWFSDNRQFVTYPADNTAVASWTGMFFDGHFGASYHVGFGGKYYAQPEVSVDYLHLHQNGYSETGGGPGFDLVVAPQTSDQLSAQEVVTLGAQWGRSTWLRSEVRFGYREIFSSNVGETTANFTGGTPFTLLGDPMSGGWVTAGFSLKSGTQFSYVALEGDADFRHGEQRYDLRVAGRSMF